MEYFHDIAQLRDSLQGIIKFKQSGKIDFIVPHMFRGQLIDRLVFTAVFGSSDSLKELAISVIRAAASLHGIYTSSIAPVYSKIRAMRNRDFCTAVFNIRGMTYSTARTVFRNALKYHASMFIFALSPNEMTFTNQLPDDYASCILGAALRENYSGPVFLQVDHLSIPDEIVSIPNTIGMGASDLIKNAYNSGYFHFDIDGAEFAHNLNISTQMINANVQYSVRRLKEFEQIQEDSNPLSLGLTVCPESQGMRLTQPDIDNFFACLTASGLSDPIRKTIFKVSIFPGCTQTDVKSDGTVEETRIDHDYLHQMQLAINEKINISGLVLHRCSNISPENLQKIANSGVAEIHFGTRFQNIFFDHPSFPSGLREELHSFLETEFGQERLSNWSDEQFYYYIRIKSWGHFKKQFWSIDEHTKSEILSEFDHEISCIFNSLNLLNTKKLTDKYCTPNNVISPLQ
jgi:fructose/tagatose bisphosphate aldolase